MGPVSPHSRLLRNASTLDCLVGVLLRGMCGLDLTNIVVDIREGRWPSQAPGPEVKTELIRMYLCSQALGLGLTHSGASEGMNVESMLKFNSSDPPSL